MPLYDYNKGKTILLVPKVYHVSAINPSSFKRVLLVPQVLKMCGTSFLVNFS